VTSSSVLSDFVAGLPFEPDRFQLEAMHAIESGAAVVVTAPTGAGKTLIAEAAIALTLSQGRRAFYTTPIKALSNQKLADFREVYGDDVGLLTGDNVIRGDAPLVVMTTEVLRNMIYADSSALDDLGVVILDEVHYLQDRYRGSVWEEVIIHLAQRVQLVNLSATIANAREFTDWMGERRGSAVLVEETHRPVPLESVYMVSDRHHDHRIDLWPIFAGRGKKPNQAALGYLKKGRGRRPRFGQPRRVEVIEELQRLAMLPAIYFIFSRAGCDHAATRVADARLGLIDDAGRAEIAAVVAQRTAHLGDTDLTALGMSRWLATLTEGVASHHAGLVPAFKETVEELFVRGLLKAVFATETLSLGINMPAKTVVLEQLSKFTGESHELLLPGDYTQLTGRAGRRGIDDHGTAVVLHQRELPFDKVASIAGLGSHPLQSSFSPSYNMAVNLVAGYDQHRAEELLNASFGQHRLASRANTLQQRLAARRSDRDEFVAAARCERGDVVAFAGAANKSDVRQQLRDFAQGLLEGDIIEPAPPDPPHAVDPLRFAVIARSYGPNPQLSLVDADGDRSTVKADDLPSTVAMVGSITLPDPFRPGDRSFRREVARRMGELETNERRTMVIDSDVDPIAACPKLTEHLEWLERARQAERDIERLERRVSRPDGDLVATFRKILRLLGSYGYVQGWSVTDRGRQLRFVYNELDLLLTECITHGLFDELGAAELAGIITMFVYEPRRNDVPGGFPTAGLAKVADEVHNVADALAEAEVQHGLEPMRAPDDGYIERLHDWAEGASLDDLFDDDAAAGDFVRVARQTLDVLRQMRDTFPTLRPAAAKALGLVDRGVVAAGGGA